MANLERGSFSINLGIVTLSGDLQDDDRQCAWELYTELVTRRGVTGKIGDDECKDFSGELYIESLQSLYIFFQNARSIMKKFPVGKIAPNNDNHLGKVINSAMVYALRPFLEKWQVNYRYWWECNNTKEVDPMKLQEEYPHKEDFLNDWSDLRFIMKSLQQKLLEVYQLTDVNN